MPGVEGLVHISELAQHHVENPREVVSQGEGVKAKIIEMDAERRRLSLSLKRVGPAEGLRGDGAPLGLSEEVFVDGADAGTDLTGEYEGDGAEAEGETGPPPDVTDESLAADAVAP